MQLFGLMTKTLAPLAIVGGCLGACGGRSGLPEADLAIEAGGTFAAGAASRSTGGYFGYGGSSTATLGGRTGVVGTGGKPSITGGSLARSTGGRPSTGGAFGTGGKLSSGGSGTGGLTTGGRFNSGATGGGPFGMGGRTSDTGGVPSSGGFAASGGFPSSGGFAASGGFPSSGGFAGSGGISGSGGLGTGTANLGGASGECVPACSSNETCVDSSCVCRPGVLRLQSVSPRNGAVGVSRASEVTASLSCTPSGPTGNDLTAAGEQGGPLSGTLHYGASPKEVVFRPSTPNSGWIAPYFPGERITVRVSRELGGPHISQFFADVTRPSSAQFTLGQTITSSQTQHIAIGDVDSDGDLDIVVQYVSEGTHVWQNDGSGSFTDSGQTLSNCGALALGDLDGDGDVDLACAPKVFINDGSGAFTELPTSLLSDAAEDIKLADLDGDGDLDAAVVGGGYATFMNDGSGSFSQVQQFTGLVGYPHRLAVGDLDNDGDLDLIISGWTASGTPTVPSQAVLFNDGTGVFTPSAQDFGTADSIGIDVGDLDGDGDLDAFVGNWDINGINHIWTNDGAGNFTVRPATSTNIVVGVALGDADGDGDLDAYVACGALYGQVRLLLNDGTGSFSDTGQSVTSLYAQYIVTGDLNGDGALDAVFTSESAPAHIWLNEL